MIIFISFVAVTIVFFILQLFLPYFTLWLYSFYDYLAKIPLSDFLTYYSGIFTGLIPIIISFVALYFSLRTESISIDTSKGVIRAFIELSCKGFKESHQGNDFRYFRPKYHDLVNHLQTLIKAHVLTEAEAELCKKMQRRVRDIDDEASKLKKSSKAFKKIEKSYHEFWDEDKYKPNIKEILKKL